MKSAFLRSCISLLYLSGLPVLRAEAELVKDLNRGPGSFSAEIEWVMPVERGVVFQMKSMAQGSELWTSDGTPQGTRLLADILPGKLGSYPGQPVRAGNRVGFRTLFPANEEQLWLSDGTEAGTRMIFDTAAEGGSGQIGLLTGTGHGLFYYVAREVPKRSGEVWFSDGTQDGTQLLDRNEDSIGRITEFHSNRAYACFLADDEELWRSDGRAAGTVLLLNVRTVTGGVPLELRVAERRIYFTVQQAGGQIELWGCGMEGEGAERLGSGFWTHVGEIETIGDEVAWIAWNPDSTRTLWYSDGTAGGTGALELSRRDGLRYFPQGGLTPWQGAMYFTAYHEELPLSNPNAGTGVELWRTDGTAAGTRLVKDVRPGPASSNPVHLMGAGAHLYFQVEGADGISELWRTDGRARGTEEVSSLLDRAAALSTGSLVAASGGSLYYAASRGLVENALWKTRPSGRGVQRLSRPEKSTGSAFTVGRGSYLEVGGAVLAFVNGSGGSVAELWRLGADGGARAVWAPGARVSGPFGFNFETTSGGQAIFSSQPVNDRPGELWASDGSRRGTRLLVRHASYHYLTDFTHSGGILYYALISQFDRTKSSLWRTDGTPEGTRQVMAADGSGPSPIWGELVDYQGVLHLMGNEAPATVSLWRSDGSAGGTVQLRESWVGVLGGFAPHLGTVGDELCFTLNVGGQPSLWRSDGTAAGTYSWPNPEGGFRAGSIGPAVDLGGVQVFQAAPPAITAALRWYRSDGTTEGTYPMLPGSSGQHAYQYAAPEGHVVVLGGRMIYPGREELSGEFESELWSSDGTAAGTYRVKDIRPGPRSSQPTELLRVGDVVYFTAETDEHGRELWKSDGTEEGTMLAADVEPGPLGSEPFGLRVMNGWLYFTAYRHESGRELYSVAVE